jgi:hypothetical protein
MTGLEWARLVDWDAAFGDDTEPDIEWLVEGFIKAGSLNALYGDMKVGKSLIMQDVSAGLATGRSVLGLPPALAVPVLYLDWENSLEDITARMRAMGYGPADLKGWLHYASYPDIPYLDTPAGGEKACELAAATGAALIVIDTTSRTIQGAENSSDTFADLYKHTLVRLRGAGHTIVRIDHEGKDPDRGQRGSSAKNADIDVLWHMTEIQAETSFRINPELKRNPYYTGFRVRRDTGPLRHVTITDALTPAQCDLAAALDSAGIPRNAGRPQIREWMKSANLASRNQDLEAVIRWRKTVGAAVSALPMGQVGGQPGQTASDLRGQSGGSENPGKGAVPPHVVGGSPAPDLNYDWQKLYEQSSLAKKRKKK